MKKSNVIKRPTSTTSSIDKAVSEFIGSAPDASTLENKQPRLVRGKRLQISHTLPPELLNRTDKQAEEMGLTRAALINLALSEYLNKY
ncbi:CopG family transcriptional regulator [Hydromonas duriensis]|uniref:CopG family transcriptional regulator n=1 Tax=Hydromonas duriensis TaxID=1527608 RepID=A0A4R6Y081_9BURK|nr:CopG family transcriptional regulator [Hydromonas duriensis]TDR26458.1 hypothetical protein DFR44_1634 [Hydromonas duriensis]